MRRVQSLDGRGWRGWSLARQLVVLQVCVVVVTVGIEAMVGVYRGPEGDMGWGQRQLLDLVALTEVALTVGIAGSLLLAGRVRRQTFDLEPAVIARQYQHHHAMLHAVREGLIITDRDGAVVLANDEARRLLNLPPDGEGRPLSQLLTDAGLADAQLAGAESTGTELAGAEPTVWAAGGDAVRDQLRVAAGRVLVVSRSPVEVDGTPIGMVTTLRDRTELQQALNELDAVRALAAALRAQSHESANRVQALVGLVELGRYDEAIKLGTQDAAVAQRLSDRLLDQVGDPALTALLLGKTALADQRGVELRLRAHLHADSPAAALRLPTQDVITVVGNLVDNALDAAAPGPGGRVDLRLLIDGEGALHITVGDSGPGIRPDDLELIFTPGWTTKPCEQPGGRGLGLALVRHAVARLGGTIRVRNGGADGGAAGGADGGTTGGAVFEVWLPGAVGDVVGADTAAADREAASA